MIDPPVLTSFRDGDYHWAAMELIVFCGIQASGKSTFFKERFFDTHVRLSLDLLNTRQREDALLHACLAAQQKAVIDNTNPLARQRQRYCSIAKASGFRAVLYHFDVEIEQALLRNAGRGEARRVPEIALRGTSKKFERPTLDEGFDEIFLVRTAPAGGWLVEAMQ